MQRPAGRKYDLDERTAAYSKAVISFIQKFPKRISSTPILTQVIRSATSIGANYREAHDAESRADFRHKIALCRKEARETAYWFELMGHENPMLYGECERLRQEAHELNSIFSASLKTMTK